MSEVSEFEYVGFRFGIDCDPYQERPSVYAKDIFEKAGLEYIEPVSKLFGAWTWRIKKNMTNDEWKELKEFMNNHFIELYEGGKIRGSVFNVYKIGENLKVSVSSDVDVKASDIQLSVFRNFFITADIECKEDGGYDVDINDIEEMMMPDLCDWFEDKFKDYTGKYKIEKY